MAKAWWVLSLNALGAAAALQDSPVVIVTVPVCITPFSYGANATQTTLPTPTSPTSPSATFCGHPYTEAGTAYTVSCDATLQGQVIYLPGGMRRRQSYAYEPALAGLTLDHCLQDCNGIPACQAVSLVDGDCSLFSSVLSSVASVGGVVAYNSQRFGGYSSGSSGSSVVAGTSAASTGISSASLTPTGSLSTTATMAQSSSSLATPTSLSTSSVSSTIQTTASLISAQMTTSSVSSTASSVSTTLMTAASKLVNERSSAHVRFNALSQQLGSEHDSALVHFGLYQYRIDHIVLRRCIDHGHGVLNHHPTGLNHVGHTDRHLDRHLDRHPNRLLNRHLNIRFPNSNHYLLLRQHRLLRRLGNLLRRLRQLLHRPARQKLPRPHRQPGIFNLLPRLPDTVRCY
ncbi:hypothetical protein LTR74_002882 [Friedmanniomyces endolithicus]|nr:hypothetical protein LTR74_002882 [Friedmanniomyces endolithicus]